MTEPVAFGCRSWAKDPCTTCNVCFDAGCPFVDQAFAPSPSPPPLPGSPGWCQGDVPGRYGDLRLGAAGFAPLVGKACAGPCYAECARWSTIALTHGDRPVDDPIACRQLCRDTDGCDVFTHEDGACSLMRTFNGSPALSSVGTASPNATSSGGAISGGATCELHYLPFPDAISVSDVASDDPQCVPDGVVYGEGEGACAVAALLAIHATPTTISRGSNQGWWDAAATASGVAPQSVALVEEGAALTTAQCQERCAVTGGCAGFTVSAGVCQLRTELACSPRFGLVGESAREHLAASTAVAGLVQLCVNSSDIAAGKPPDPFYTACNTPRCSEPTVDGVFRTDGTFAPSSCHYEYLDRAG